MFVAHAFYHASSGFERVQRVVCECFQTCFWWHLARFAHSLRPTKPKRRADKDCSITPISQRRSLVHSEAALDVVVKAKLCNESAEEARKTLRCLTGRSVCDLSYTLFAPASAHASEGMGRVQRVLPCFVICFRRVSENPQHILLVFLVLE